MTQHGSNIFYENSCINVTHQLNTIDSNIHMLFLNLLSLRDWLFKEGAAHLGILPPVPTFIGNLGTMELSYHVKVQYKFKPVQRRGCSDVQKDWAEQRWRFHHFCVWSLRLFLSLALSLFSFSLTGPHYGSLSEAISDFPSLLKASN